MSDVTRRGLLSSAAAVTATVLTSPVEQVSAAEVSTLKPGEAVVLLPTAAHRSEDGANGWCHSTPGSTCLRTATCDAERSPSS